MTTPVLPFDLSVVEAPAETSPVSLEEAKVHLRVEIDNEDDLIQGYLDAATTLVEEVYTWRALLTRTLSVVIRVRPDGTVWLPYPPVQSLESVTNADTDVELGPTQFSLRPASGIVVLGSGYCTPGRELVIEYVAGYGEADVVPKQFKQAILLLVGHWYENRESVITGTIATPLPQGVERLTLPWRAERPD